MRPAIDVGISVSRVGGAAQTKGMKKVAGNLRLDLAAYRDLEAFAAFASDLDAASKKQLERGQRLVELLKQSEHAPQPVEYQIISIWSANEGVFDVVPVEDVRRYEAELHESIRANAPQVYDQIAGGKQLDDDSKAAILRVNEDLARNFQASSGERIVREAEAEPLDSKQVAKNQLNVSRS